MHSVAADVVAGRHVAVAVSCTIWLGNIGGDGGVVNGNRAGVVGRMTNEERILELIRSSKRALTDREIREQTGIEPHAHVNQICNRLAGKGFTRRETGPRGFLVNTFVVEDESDTAYPTITAKEREFGTLVPSEIDLRRALIVIPCSGKKHRGGAEDRDGVSVLDFLPDDLSQELSDVRQRNARECRLDDSLRMPAAERYCGSLYEAAGWTSAHVAMAAAGLAIVSGGYGIVLAGEQIGWYEQRFDEAMWPNKLVGRCLAAYAEAIQARTVIGLFGRTTPYAKAFRSVKWPADIRDALLLSPEPREGVALVKVPRAIGESLAEIASTGAIGADWTSSDDVPVRITRVGTGSARGAVEDTPMSQGERPTASHEASHESASPQAMSLGLAGAREITTSGDENETAKAGTDALPGEVGRRRRLGTANAGRLAEEIAGDFYEGGLDLAARGAAITTGWSMMPEVAITDELRRGGASERSIRQFLTFVSAMDRARDASRLWRVGCELFQSHPEVFDPVTVSSMTPARLSGLLSASGVSQRHGPDSDAWRRIGRSLTEGASAICRLVGCGVGDALEVLADLRSVDSAGRPRFPMLKGPKVGAMWVRIMANPGAARIDRMAKIPVAVDTNVRRVTRNLGVVVTTPEGAMGKRMIQSAWRDAMTAANIGGPSGISGTCAALDPALWFFGKYGCSHCEAISRRIPIGRACRACRLEL